VLLYAVNCCADATAHYVKRGAKKKVYVAAPVVAPAVVVQKQALVPAAKVYIVPVVQLKTPIASGWHLLKRITIRPIRINQGKEYVAPTLAPAAVVEQKAPLPQAKLYSAPVVGDNKKAPVPEAKLYTAPVKVERKGRFAP
jgi:hypothetical protein